jgi:hypothetical protein
VSNVCNGKREVQYIVHHVKSGSSLNPSDALILASVEADDESSSTDPILGTVVYSPLRQAGWHRQVASNIVFHCPSGLDTNTTSALCVQYMLQAAWAALNLRTINILVFRTFYTSRGVLQVSSSLSTITLNRGEIPSMDCIATRRHHNILYVQASVKSDRASR